MPIPIQTPTQTPKRCRHWHDTGTIAVGHGGRAAGQYSRQSLRHFGNIFHRMTYLQCLVPVAAPFLRRLHLPLSLSFTNPLSIPPPKKMETQQSLQQQITSLSVSGNPNPLLVLCGKSSEENDIAQALKRNNALKLADEQLSINVRSEMPDDMSFRSDAFMNALSTRRFGRFLVWSPRLPSTHDIVSQNFSELPIGTVCVSDVQFKGRGRSRNVWESPPGCLLFSFTLQMEDGRVVPLVQYVVSLAVTEAIAALCESKGLPHVDVRIKWPNDLYLNDLKIGGILCTSAYRSKKFNVSAGIGLNVDNEKPTTCLNKVLKQCASELPLRREDILAAFFNKFEILFDIFMNQGFPALEDLYYRTWLHSGQRVFLEEKGEGQSVENIAVTIQGLTSSGYLLAIAEDNKYYELHPDGNSFDFFKGLVRRKVEER